ncbi:MAG TPA: hypothetical protein VGQ83_04655 [Polyangia bacterium]
MFDAGRPLPAATSAARSASLGAPRERLRPSLALLALAALGGLGLAITVLVRFLGLTRTLAATLRG